MLFLVRYEIAPEHHDTVLERFLKIGDGEPAGAKILGNWFSVTQLEGWAVVEAADSMGLGA